MVEAEMYRLQEAPSQLGERKPLHDSAIMMKCLLKSPVTC
jgi:hypothetical protein